MPRRTEFWAIVCVMPAACIALGGGDCRSMGFVSPLSLPSMGFGGLSRLLQPGRGPPGGDAGSRRRAEEVRSQARRAKWAAFGQRVCVCERERRGRERKKLASPCVMSGRQREARRAEQRSGRPSVSMSGGGDQQESYLESLERMNKERREQPSIFRGDSSSSQGFQPSSWWPQANLEDVRKKLKLTVKFERCPPPSTHPGPASPMPPLREECRCRWSAKVSSASIPGVLFPL